MYLYRSDFDFISFCVYLKTSKSINYSVPYKIKYDAIYKILY